MTDAHTYTQVIKTHVFVSITGKWWSNLINRNFVLLVNIRDIVSNVYRDEKVENLTF